MNAMNYAEEEVSIEAAGVIVTLFALNSTLWKHPHNDLVRDAYEKLMDYASEHPEHSAIYRMID